MLTRLRYLRLARQHLGARWLAFRLGYAARIRLGYLRRQTPISTWCDHPAANWLASSSLFDAEIYRDYRRHSAPQFFFTPADRLRYQPLLSQWDNGLPSSIAEADGVAAGHLRYFAHTTATVGFPPNWHTNPFTGEHVPGDRHWSDIPDFGFGDIKIIWEASRFGFTYALVRAYWRTGNEHYAETFWQLVEHWREHNPPNCGPNWKCGQETSFRVMAWCFGLYGFLDCTLSTPERVANLAQMIAISGQRIAANFAYALNQKNNHGISEAMGLWTIGLLFPEFRQASDWTEQGRAALEAQGAELIYDDGAFSQHSVNYHRLVLHDYAWALRLGDLNGQSVNPELRKQVGRAADFLYQIQEEASGQVPCYGQNDGALVLPLNNCDYQDFRPVIQTLCYLRDKVRSYEAGPWDEDLLWLFGPDALNAPVQSAGRVNLQASTGGYYTLRSRQGFAFTRCGVFRHRPGQVDLLHVDLWWRGQNLAVDAGTFSYNAPPPWDNALALTRYHNTVEVDGQDQMAQAGRFLWLPWAHGQTRYTSISAQGLLTYWEGEHDGYQRLASPVHHRRGVLRLDDGWWLVLDRLESQSEHTYRLHWLFPDVPYDWDIDSSQLTLHFPVFSYHILLGARPKSAVYSFVRADEHSPRGWRSRYYQHREPALSVDATTTGTTMDFWTLLGPGAASVVSAEQAIHVRTTAWSAAILLGRTSSDPLVTSASVIGDIQDRLGDVQCTFC